MPAASRREDADAARCCGPADVMLTGCVPLSDYSRERRHIWSARNPGLCSIFAHGAPLRACTGRFPEVVAYPSSPRIAVGADKSPTTCRQGASSPSGARQPESTPVTGSTTTGGGLRCGEHCMVVIQAWEEARANGIGQTVVHLAADPADSAVLSPVAN